MRILFIVPYVPNLIRVRPYNLIRSLAARGNQVTVCTVYSDSRERQDIDPLRQNCQTVAEWPQSKLNSLWNCLLAIPTSVPLQAVYSWNPNFAKFIQQLCYSPKGERTYDVIHIEHLRGVKYGLTLMNMMKQRSNPIPVVWDSVDSISLLFRLSASQSRGIKRWISKFELPRTEKFESHLISQFSDICVTSKNDRAAFDRLGKPGQKVSSIHVIPNGVDLDYFQQGLHEKRLPGTLVVTGKMSYHANVTMVLYLVHEIMPHIWAGCPQAKLQIVGKDPSQEIRALASNPLIEVVGEVPDIRPYLQNASVALTPIRYGVGIQNKVLEAMACGTPVVSTSQAVSAINVTSGEEILVADAPEEFAKVVCRLLGNAQERHNIGDAGRKYVEKYHNWFNIAGELENVYDQAGR